MTWKRVALIAAIAVGALLFVAVIAGYVDQRPKGYRIPSQSMEPTLEVGDRVISVKGDDPERGDIYVYYPPLGAETVECGEPGAPEDGRPCPRPTEGRSRMTFIARVVGMPGDRLAVVGGRTRINGRLLDEDGVRPSADCPLCNLRREITIPPDHFFMMGDNRGASSDSREWGPVPRDSLRGPAVWRYWPLDRFGSP